MEVSMEMSGISSQDVRYRGICRVHGATIAIEKARHARNVLNLKQFTICIRVKG